MGIIILQEAFPELVEEQNHLLYFQDRSGAWAEDIRLTDVDLSNRTINSLRQNGVFSVREVACLEVSVLREFNHIGVKIEDELVRYMAEHSRYITEDTGLKSIRDTYDFLIRTFLEDASEAQRKPFEKAIEESIVENLDSLTEEMKKDKDRMAILLQSDKIKKLVEEILEKEILEEGVVCTIPSLEELIPSFYVECGIFRHSLKNLQNRGIIEDVEDGYRKKKIYLFEWISGLQGNTRAAVELRLQEKSFGECGQALHISRERVRQIVNKAFQEKPELREDDYIYWYSEYALDFEAMNMIFNINRQEYVYVSLQCKAGTRIPEEMSDDPNITSRVYINLNRYINRNSIMIAGKFVPCQRGILCREMAKAYCSVSDMTFKEFYGIYIDFLKVNEKHLNPKLLFPSERAFEVRLQESMYILMKYGRRFRYYPIQEYDIRELVDNLHFEQFKNVEISTLKIFREYPELMEEFNILDEYELHNLLKKTEPQWNEDHRFDITFTRMPFISFGKADRAKQTEEFLYRVAPVTFDEYGSLYEQEYGVLSRTVQANMTSYINQYYHEGVYTVDQPLFNKEERDYMSSRLTEDFYFIEDVKDIFSEKFGKKNLPHLNSRSIREIGYMVYTNYLVKNIYVSAKEYFTKLLTKDMLLDVSKFDPRMGYVQQFNQTLDTLRSEYRLIEYRNKKYVRYDYFLNAFSYLSKEDLERYVDEAIEASKDKEFFTVMFLKREGFNSELHHLQMPVWFNEALLKNSKKLRFIKVGGGIVFYKGNKQRTSVDFLRFVLTDFVKMNIDDFITYLSREYGISFTREKVIWIIHNSDMYYNQKQEMVYVSKDAYYRMK